MAYMNFAEPVLALAPTVARHDPIPAKTSLTALEWSVVALARRDSLASLQEPGRIAIAIATLFGERPDNRLADPRLEALRRLSVHAWHRSFALPESEIAAFREAGFTTEQLELVLTSVSRGRVQRRRRH